jgi:hypothetical protein
MASMRLVAWVLFSLCLIICHGEGYLFILQMTGWLIYSYYTAEVGNVTSQCNCVTRYAYVMNPEQ